MTTKKEATESVDAHPDVRKDIVVSGEHDLTDHPAVVGGVLRNVGDTVIGRDESAPTFNRPIPAQAKPSSRSTTTSDPDKKSVKSPAKGDGAGPES